MNPRQDRFRPAGADNLPTSEDIAPARLVNPAGDKNPPAPDSDMVELNRAAALQSYIEPQRSGKRSGIGRVTPLGWVVTVIILLAGAGAGASYYANRTSVDKSAQQNSSAPDLSALLKPDNNKQDLHINFDTVIEGKKLTATGPVAIQNEADSDRAFTVQQADGTNLFTVDTSTGRVGIGGAPTGSAALQVAGNISTNGSIVATGGNIVIGPQGIRIGNTLVCTANGCISSTSAVPPTPTLDVANVALLNKTQIFTGDSTFISSGNSFTGNGAGLTGLNASNIASGSLNDSRLSSNVALLNRNSQIFRNTSNSTGAFQIQNTAGTSNLFIADTVNNRIAIDKASANYPLDVAGDINSTTGLRVNGTLLCTTGGCTPSSGSGDYIQNTTTPQTADFSVTGSGTVGGNFTDNGSALFKNTANSTAAFEIQNANGTAHLFVADTQNARVAIAQASANYPLDVGGDINTTTGVRVGGTLVCSATGCTPDGGSSNYIQNGTALQTANFAIQSSANNQVVALIRGASGQSADVLDLVSGDGGTNLLSVGGTGATTFRNSINSTTAFQIQNAAGTSNLLIADTANSRVGIGTAPAGATLEVQQEGTNNILTLKNSGGSTVANVAGSGFTTLSSALTVGNGQANTITALSVNNTLSTTKGVVIKGAASQSADLLEVQDSTTAVLASISGTGAALFKNNANSTTAFQIQNASSTSILGIDTTNSIISLGLSTARDLGTWSSASSLPQPVLGSGTAVYKGYAYVIGGRNSVSSSYLATTYYAKLNSDGTLGAWQASTLLPNARLFPAVTQANGYIYAMGGASSSCGLGSGQSTVYYAALNSNGSISSWSTNTNVLPQGLCGSTAAAYNGYIYVFGGSSNTAQNTVYYAKLNADGSTGTWQTNANALPVIMNEQSTAVINGYVYVVYNSGVYYAKINADGSVGSWTTSPNSVPQSTAGQQVVAIDNYLYDLGGTTSATYYAKVNDDHTVGSWSAGSNSVPSLAQYPSATVSNKYAYLIGGTGLSTVYYSSVQGVTRNMGQESVTDQLTVGNGLTVMGNVVLQPSADSTSVFSLQNASGGSLLNVDSVNNAISLLGNNSGALGTWSTNANTLPNPRSASTSQVANGYIYEIGGYNNSGYASTVYYAKLNADGSTGAWQTNTNALPVAIKNINSATANGFIYIMGGATSGPTLQSTVYYAKLNADGSTGAWQTNTNALPSTRVSAASFANNGYIYLIGGCTSVNGGCGTAQSTVYYAKLNADGSTGAWQTNTNALPAGRGFPSYIVSSGYAYIMGGQDSSNIAQSTVYYAKLNADGSTGAWSTNSNSLPRALTRATATVSNGYAYVAGGYDGTTNYSTVYYAKLNADGSTGAWSTNSNSLPSVRSYATSVTSNGYMYVIGGCIAGDEPCTLNAQTTVYYASTSRVQIGSNLDLIGIQGGDGSAGGSIHANNITAVGNLNVQGQANFSQGVGITGNLSVAGPVAFQNATNSTTAFQIQNSSGSQVLTADTANMRLGVDVAYSAMSTPVGLSVGAATSGGSLTANSIYRYKVTAIDSAGGETAASSEASGTTNANLTLPVTWTAVTGASGYKIYRTAAGGASNSEVYLTTVLTNSFTDNGSATAGTAAPPSVTTAYVSTNISNSSLQLSIGGLGTPTGQVYISGTQPVLVGASPFLSNAPSYGTLSGNYLYLQDSVAGKLSIYDVTNPLSPAGVSSLTVSNEGNLAVSGKYAYIAKGNPNGLRVVDISNPASPSIVTTVSLLTPAGDGVKTISVQGNYLYILTANAFQVFDLSNPASPLPKGVLATNSINEDVAVQGKYAYVVTNGNPNVRVVDISNPSNPTTVASINTVAMYYSVAVQGRYLYAKNGNNGVKFDIYDISNPTAPTLIGSVADNSNCNSSGCAQIFIRDRYAYVAAGGQYFEVFDISNPYKPILLNGTSLPISSQLFGLKGRYAYAGNYTGKNIEVYDLGGAYVQQLETGGIQAGGLYVDGSADFGAGASIRGGLNIGQNLQAAGSLGIGAGANIQGSVTLSGAGNSLAVPGVPVVTPQGTTGSTNYSYTITALNPYGGETTASAVGSTATGNATLSATNFNRITWSAVTGASGYKIYRTIAAGTSPTTTGLIGSTASTTFDDTGLAANGSVSPTTDTTSQLTVQGSVLFKNASDSTTAFQVQNSSGAAIVNVDTIKSRLSVGNIGTATGQLYVSGQNPVLVGQTASVGMSNTPTDASAISGNYEYFASLSTNKLVVYDISNPANPVLVGQNADSNLTFPMQVAVQGHYAYVAEYNNPANLVVYDISNPSAPTYVGENTDNTIVYAHYLYVAGRYAYVSYLWSTPGVAIYDISNPAKPTRVGNISVSTANSIYVSGRYMYSPVNNTLQIYDVSNPASPSLTSTVATAGGINVAVSGRYAYLAGNNKLQVFNISNPASPVDVSSGGVATSNGQSIVIQGRYAYVGGYSPGKLQVFDISNPASPVDVSSGGVAASNSTIQVMVSGRFAYIVSSSSPQLEVFDLGGAYSQQLEAGGAAFGALQVNNNGQVAGDFNIQGNAGIGRSLKVDGTTSTAGIVVQGTSLFQTLTNSTSAFQVQNSGGVALFAINTSGNTITLGDGTLNTAVAIKGNFFAAPTAGNDSNSAFQVQSSGGTTALNIDTTGPTLVTVSNLSVSGTIMVNGVALSGYNLAFNGAKYYASAAQTIGTDGAAATIISLDTATYGPTTGYSLNASPQGIKVANAGYYQVIAQVTWANNTTGARVTCIRVYDNTNAFVRDDACNTGSSPAGTETTSVQSSTITYLPANYLVSILAEQLSGGNLNTVGGANLTWLELIPIGH